jgi:hypothetical protein
VGCEIFTVASGVALKENIQTPKKMFVWYKIMMMTSIK